jgi:hypothetical protein
MKRFNKFLCLSALLIGSASQAFVVGADRARYCITPGGSLNNAAMNGNLKLVRRLIADGVPPDAPNRFGTTPLMSAGYMGHTKIGKLLIDEILKPIKQKINAIVAFLSLKKKCKYMKPLDREVMKLIARQLYEPVAQEKQKLFTQINAIANQQEREKLFDYVRMQLKPMKHSNHCIIA